MRIAFFFLENTVSLKRVVAHVMCSLLKHMYQHCFYYTEERVSTVYAESSVAHGLFKVKNVGQVKGETSRKKYEPPRGSIARTGEVFDTKV